MTQQINLYEDRLRPRHELVTARNLGVATLVLLVLMAALSLWSRAESDRKTQQAEAMQAQVLSTQSQLTELSKAVEARKITPALAAEIEIARSQLNMRADVLAVLESGPLGNSTGFSSVMTGFAHQAQSDLWLTGFALTAGGENIEIRGRLLDPGKLPAYVQRLRDEPVFEGRRFAALEMQAARDENRVQTDSQVTGRVEISANGLDGASAFPLQPRFVEFVLRSEKAASGDSQ